MKTKMKKADTKQSRQAAKEPRKRYEVPCDCGLLADAVYARLEGGDTEMEIRWVIYELEEAVAFLQNLPEDATLRDLDIESGFSWGKESLEVIREKQAA